MALTAKLIYLQLHNTQFSQYTNLLKLYNLTVVNSSIILSFLRLNSYETNNVSVSFNSNVLTQTK